MANVPKQRQRIPAEKKQEVYRFLDEGHTAAEVARRTGVAEMSVANLRKARQQQAVAEEEATAKQKLESAEFELSTLKLYNKYLRRYARAETEVQKKDVEIAYLTARLKEVFKDEWVRSLGEASDDDDDDT
jgi:transposase-like protein